jgi:hypothetical protein
MEAGRRLPSPPPLGRAEAMTMQRTRHRRMGRRRPSVRARGRPATLAARAGQSFGEYAVVSATLAALLLIAWQLVFAPHLSTMFAELERANDGARGEAASHR